MLAFEINGTFNKKRMVSAFKTKTFFLKSSVIPITGKGSPPVSKTTLRNSSVRLKTCSPLLLNQVAVTCPQARSHSSGVETLH